MLVASNIIAEFQGSLAAANSQQQIPISLSVSDFTTVGAKTILGFHLQGGGGLDPAAVKIVNAAGGVVPTRLSNPNLLAAAESLTVAELAHGNYTLIVSGEKATRGAFRLNVRLAGDVNGDRAVNLTDATIIRSKLGVSQGNPAFIPDADANMDGTISSFDYSQARDNIGDSTTISPLSSLSMAINPAAIVLPDGSLITNSSVVAVQGNTLPQIGVRLETGSDNNFDNGSATANASGIYSFANVVLASGNNTIQARARDGFGQQVAKAISLVLDAELVSPDFDLSASSDSGQRGDQTTSAANVTLVGMTDPGAEVELLSAGTPIDSTIASGSGKFQFVGVSLTATGNTFTTRATDSAGNVREVTQEFQLVAPETIGPDAVLRWNGVALGAIRLDASSPPVASRALAMVGSAMFDAVSAIDGTPSYMVYLSPPNGASAEAAAASAAYNILSYLYPAQQTVFDAALNASLLQVVDGASEQDGVEFGQAVAAAIIAQRVNDGARNFTDYIPVNADPGTWQPTAPLYAEAFLPQWADVIPFALDTPDQFRPAAPPSLDSQEYAAAFNEVKLKGRASGSTRTADETQSALFWADGLGTTTPAGHWNQIAMQLAAEQGYGLSANARLFAQLNVALADAAISSWDAKYAYGLWRPLTAIGAADSDSNDQTQADADWAPLLVTPNFPTYTSGHSTFSGAAQVVLESYFGAATAFTSTTEAFGVNARSFSSFAAAAEEAGQSRILGGIHFQFDNQVGLSAGRQVGNHVLNAFSMTEDSRAPTVNILRSDVDVVTSQNIVVSGQAIDNLSGVKSVQASIDLGTYFPVTFNADGNFSIATGLALSGTADGKHTVSVRATDFAGNTSDATAFTFVLDTQAPTLAIQSPSILANLTMDSRLTGVAAGTGSAVTSLTYSFDGGPELTVVYDQSSGQFDQVLELSELSIGEHTLVTTVRDAAGHEATDSRIVVLQSLIPLALESFSPSNGAMDAGTTEKPKITFSRPIDPATITENNFFATDTTGEKLLSHIVVTDDARAAWLFIDGPMPGASTITITVDGTTILSDDGTSLDAAGTGTPGSKLLYSFSTVGLTGLPGTVLTGIVADPGADLRPHTVDDVRRGADGILMTSDDEYLNPLANTWVYVLGMEHQAVFTDTEGRFTLAAVPSGNVKLVIDGRTANNVPDGHYFPEMVMELTIETGQVNTVMGSMGSRQQSTASELIQGVYLPRLKAAILQPVSDSQPTVIDVPAEAAPDLTAEQRALLFATVQPGTAIGSDGEVLTDVKVGISTVPTELIREMLPPGVSEPPFTITVQAPGVVTFTTPVAVSYPNVDNAPPGTKMLFISFNHATGRLEIDGTATVTPDGKSVVTDPDSGITHPGWHFTITGTRNPFDLVNNPGQCGGGNDWIAEDFPVGLFLLNPLVAPRLLLPDFQLELDFRAYLLLLGTGFLGQEMVTRFMVGTRADFVHPMGSQLANLTLASGTFNSQKTNVENEIAAKIQMQANSGFVDNTALSISPPNISFGFMADGTVLKSLIGGTQGIKVTIKNFDADATLDPNVGGGPGTYSGVLEFEICDDFGVDTSDLYAPPLADFWVLQHHRFGHRPFRNIIRVEVPIGGTFTVPTGYTELDKNISGASQNIQFVEAFDNNAIVKPVGFGTNPIVYYHIQVERGTTITGTVMPGGEQPNVVLPPNRYYTATFYQPSTNMSAVISSVSSPSGATTLFSTSPGSSGEQGSQVDLTDFGGADSDLDGLPDVGEKAIGTRADVADSDGDGISDAVEIEQGLDPLGGKAFPTGVVAALQLQGESQRIAVDSDKAYVATGSFGLAIVDGTQFSRPIVLGQLDLPNFASDVAVDGSLGIAAVAIGSQLALVDVVDTKKPKLIRTVDVGASKLVAANGLAYAVAGGSGGGGNEGVAAFETTDPTLSVVDMASGMVIQSLTLPGQGEVTGLAREGTMLYVFVSGSDTFIVVDISDEGAANVRSQIGVDIASSDVGLFVGDGVAWLAGSGLRSVDVSNPNSPQIIQTPTGDEFFTARRFALNGSGLGLLLPDGGNFVQVFDTSDPNNVSDLLLQLNLTGNAQDIAISRGVAYVATSSGLEVVNYLPFDNTGVAPTVTVSAVAIDQNSTAPGIQIIEGTTVPIRLVVSDNVQIRNVELLVNGQLTRSDISYPFDFFVAAPSIANAGSSFTVQIRAIDTGGNVTLSNALSFELIEDTSQPAVTSFVPPTNSSVVEPIQIVQVRFSEPMATNSVSAQSVRVVDANANVLVATSFQLRDDDRLVQLVFPALLMGNYRIIVSGTVTDRAGNALGQQIESGFTLIPRAEMIANITDEDPTMSGLQLFEGSNVPLSVQVAPGVAVQKVELLIDDAVFASDTSAPYQFVAVVPNIALAINSMRIVAKVTDTSGLATFTSPELFIGILEDVTPPTIVNSTPSALNPGFEGISKILISFSESLDPNSVSVADFNLFRAGPSGDFDGSEDSVDINSIELASSNANVTLLTPALVKGNYRLVVLGGSITDRALNSFGAIPVVIDFTLQEQLLVNASFETGDFSGWTSVNSNNGLSRVVSSWNASPDDGTVFLPIEGASFALLQSGQQNVPQAITQTFSAIPGDVITGSTFFDTTDYLPFADYGYVRIYDADENLVETLFSANVSSVGDYGQTPWTQWEYVFTAAGLYRIEAGVANVGDSGVHSLLGIDHLTLRHGVTAPIIAPFVEADYGAYADDISTESLFQEVLSEPEVKKYLAPPPIQAIAADSYSIALANTVKKQKSSSSKVDDNDWDIYFADFDTLD